MSELFAAFPKTSKAEWISLLHKELKGESPDVLHKFNRIEEIALPSYFHTEDAHPDYADPGLAPFTRGNHATSNDWSVGTCFRIDRVTETNKAILDALMKGTNALSLHATNDQPIDFDALLDSVGLEFIQTTFHPRTIDQAKAFIAKTGAHASAVVMANSPDWMSNAAAGKGKAVRLFGVNAYAVQQAGGTTWQETAIALAEGHELLVAQLEQGLTIDEAAANLHFTFGIGNKYFYEIAKFRAFRTCWAKIVSEYGPAYPESAATFITAQTGFVHISVSDPYTNLLRQTTEAMSAVLGGVEKLVVQPYDWHTTTPNTAFTRRMATNISLLLKEESYLDKVADPAGGSYALDNLTDAITERAWSSFQEIERGGGIRIPAVRAQWSEAIREKAAQRIELVREKTQVLIGINTYPNPEKVNNSPAPLPEGWNGIPSLNLEAAVKHHRR